MTNKSTQLTQTKNSTQSNLTNFIQTQSDEIFDLNQETTKTQEIPELPTTENETIYIEFPIDNQSKIEQQTQSTYTISLIKETSYIAKDQYGNGAKIYKTPQNQNLKIGDIINVDIINLTEEILPKDN